MNQMLALTLSFIGMMSVAKADQAATLTCTGSKVILTVKSPYLGENSKAAQELYVLKSKDSNSNETANTAFFLNVELDIGGVRHGGAGTLVYTGKNEVGGSFQMITSALREEGDGTVIRQTSSGTITYNHGPLKGRNEAVSCVLE